MSFAAVRFALSFPDLSPYAQLTLIRLADRAGQTGHCFPSQAWLAEKTGLSVSSVRRALTELETVKAIKRSKRSDPLGRTSDDYLILIPRVPVPQNTTLPVRQNTTPRSHRTTIPTSPTGVGKEEEETSARKLVLIKGGRS